MPREGSVRFEPLPPPTQGEVERLLKEVRHRVLRLLEKEPLGYLRDLLCLLPRGERDGAQGVAQIVPEDADEPIRRCASNQLLSRCLPGSASLCFKGNRARPFPSQQSERAMKLVINGVEQGFDVPEDMPLLWVLRDVLGMTGTKYGCGAARCGACTVHVDGVRASALPSTAPPS